MIIGLSDPLPVPSPVPAPLESFQHDEAPTSVAELPPLQQCTGFRTPIRNIRLKLRKDDVVKDIICVPDLTIRELVQEYGGRGAWEAQALGMALSRSIRLRDIEHLLPTELTLARDLFAG